DMLHLENFIDPSVFRKFIQGFLTARRSAKFSFGISTDMIIEQSLMKSMQTDGVFDGYSDYTKNIKVAEQRRRTTKISSSSDILFDRFMTVPTNQQQFLANTHYKSRFISMLSEKLKAADNFVKQANNDADVLIIETALEKFNTNTTIVVDKYRYLSFVNNTLNYKRVQLSCLPPTSAAAYQHLCRVNYQVQVWLGNELDPENWGWVLKDNSLEPIQTLLPPAPEKLLNIIFCNCKKGGNYNSGCKKVGLFCSQVCSNCEGKSYCNVESNTTDEDAYDISEEISDPYFFLEQSIKMQQRGEEEESEE
ncbi:hypothetical protein AVEN_227867-1, partial [Araneus ventricosus]